MHHFQQQMHHVGAAILTSCLLIAFAVSAEAQPRVAGEPVAVTGGEQLFTSPKWSSDPNRLAFSGERYAGIYVLDLASGTIETVTDAPASGFGFSWSPDGQSILSRIAHFENRRRLDAVALFDVTSGDSINLTDLRTDMPALPQWDAAGANVILYAGERLEVFSVKDQRDAAGKAAIRPWVAGQAGLARVDPASRDVERLTLGPDDQMLNLTPSPDGRRVAFETLQGRLFATSADGSQLIELGRGHRPSWSPDGEWIVFMKAEDDGHTFTRSDLYVARSDGSGVFQLTDTTDQLEMNPSWSPDGSRIAYDDFNDGIIYVLSITR